MLTRREFSSGLLNNFATRTPAWVAKAGPRRFSSTYKRRASGSTPAQLQQFRLRRNNENWSRFRAEGTSWPGGSSQARSEVALT